MIQRITKEQKKIVIVSGIGFVCLIVFWTFIYLPSRREVASLRKRTLSVESQIAAIKKVPQGKELTDVVKDLKIKLDQSKSYLPESDEAVRNDLSREADKLGITIKDISLLAEKSIEKPIAGFQIQELRISIKLVSDLRNFTEFLNVLRNKFPYLVKVEEIIIKNTKPQDLDIDISIEILAYHIKN